MRENGGIVGFPIFATRARSSGMWDNVDVATSKVNNSWPRTRKITSSTATATTLNENGSVTFNLVTEGFENGELIYYTINSITGSVLAADFTDGLLSGSFSVTNNAAALTKTMQLDDQSEVTESFTVQFRLGSTSGTILLTSEEIFVNNATYSVSPSVGNVNEGTSITWNVTTTNLNNTTLYYTLEGVAAADVGAISGSFSVTSGSGSFVTTTVADSVTEGSETITCRIRILSTSGAIVASTTAIINDTSLAPVVTADVTTLNEGDSVTFTVTTSGLANGTTLYWTLNSVSGEVNGTDFSDSLSSGSFTVNSNSATIVRTLSSDLRTEGTESFNLSIRTISITGTVVATTPTVTITDTSLSPVASISPSATTVNEGDTVTFTVNMTNFTSGTLYWSANKLSGKMLKTDFSDDQTTGTITIASSTGSFTRTFTNDTKTEGTETFNFRVHRDSPFTAGGDILGTSSTISVLDTSTGTTELTPTQHTMTSLANTISAAGGKIFVTGGQWSAATNVYSMSNNHSNSWTQYSMPWTGAGGNVVWTGTNFIWAAGLNGSNGTTTFCYTSTDGINWTQRTGLSGGYGCAVSTNGVVSIIGYASSTANAIHATLNRSTNHGVTWSQVSTGVSASWANKAAFVDGKIIMLPAPHWTGFTTNVGLVSYDNGATWSTFSIPVAGGWGEVVYGNGVYLTLYTASNSSTYMTSTNGINWTQRSLPAFVAVGGYLWDGNQFVALFSDRAYTSPDGITWTQRTVSSSASGLVYDGSAYFALIGAAGSILYSYDSITWSSV
jgi:uncharacterized cupredoxin-like copper-binding protein